MLRACVRSIRSDVVCTLLSVARARVRACVRSYGAMLCVRGACSRACVCTAERGACSRACVCTFIRSDVVCTLLSVARARVRACVRSYGAMLCVRERGIRSDVVCTLLSVARACVCTFIRSDVVCTLLSVARARVRACVRSYGAMLCVPC